MPSVFTRIIRGELPGRFVYRDERCVAFLSIEPVTPGHTLVVPINEVDHWIDLDPALVEHLMIVAQRIGRAIDETFHPRRVALAIVGLDVPHVHIHVCGIEDEHGLDFSRVDRSPDPEVLTDIAERLRMAVGD